MGLIELLHETRALLDDAPLLVRLPADRTAVFVGDTHGDLVATERVLDRYPAPEHVVVFLGDAVDRGPDSRGNLARILSAKLAHPEAIHLLMGNHEAWAVSAFSPADFWFGLDDAQRAIAAVALGRLPLAAWHPAGILGLHGALPGIESLDAFEGIEAGSDAWRAVTWGDWHETERDGPAVGGRPRFGRATFGTRSKRLGVRVLVRSHQPSAPTCLFDDRCLTVFTSCAYGDGRRRIAVLPTGRSVRTARDLDLVGI